MVERQVPRVIREPTKMVVPSAGLTYIPPAIGPKAYETVGKTILDKQLLVPTGDLTAPLVYDAFWNPKAIQEKGFDDVRVHMKNWGLWVYNRNIWTSKGVYVIQDTKAEGRTASFNVEELEDLLSKGNVERGVRFSQDNRIRFAPKSTYTFGEHKPEDLARQGNIIATYGVRGAEQIGQVSLLFKYKPRNKGLDIQEGQNPNQTVAALYSEQDLGIGGLDVDGNGLVVYDYAFAFGVEPSGEASVSQKIQVLQ